MKNQLNIKMILFSGLSLLGIDLFLFFIALYLDSYFGIKIISMIGACHVGGRLAFIGTGLELGLGVIPIITIIILYNTTYLLIVFSIFVILSKRAAEFKLVKSLRKKIDDGRKFRSNWNLLSIAIFIWIPLPLTGAVNGSIIAHLEGHSIKNILLVAIPTMWIGVISWTLAFDELYQLLKLLGPGVSILLTVFLLIFPIIFNLIRNLFKKPKRKFT